MACGQKLKCVGIWKKYTQMWEATTQGIKEWERKRHYIHTSTKYRRTPTHVLDYISMV